MKNIRGNITIIWPIVILIIAFGAFILKPWETTKLETISVSGEGKVDVTPNVAKLSATIATKNQDLDIARKENEQKVTTLISRLKELQIAQNDIKTQSISAYPTREIQSFPPQRDTTNQISTTLEVIVRNFTIADAVIAVFTQNGATNINGPNLTLDDDSLEIAKSQAREQAVDNAKNKAEELALLSDRKVGKVTYINEQGGFNIPPPIFAQGTAELIQKSSQIQPGQNEVEVILQIDFSLK